MEDIDLILNYNTPLQTIDDWKDINLIEPSINEESCINFEEYSKCIFYPSDIDIFVSYKQTEKENLLKDLRLKNETDMEEMEDDDEEKYRTSSSDSDDDYNHEDEKLKPIRRRGKSNQLKNNKHIKRSKQRKSQKRSGIDNCKWKFIFKLFGLIS